MKEHFQDYGVRKWAGDDLIELQSEPLAALQALVEPYAPCIIQGCEVTENGNGGIKVSPCLVALEGKDSKGKVCVKIARFAGVESETSIYLTLACDPVKRLYGDGNIKDIAYDYKAVAGTQRPEEAFLEISGKEVPRLVDTLGITQKLDRVGGDASQTKVNFSEANAEELKSGNPLSKLFGAIKKWLDGIKVNLDGITTKLSSIEVGAQVNTVTSVAGKTGAVTLSKSDVGLDNVNNTSDTDKPISKAVRNALDSKANSNHTHNYLPLVGGDMDGSGGIQYPLTTGTNRSGHYISAGGGYGTGSGKYGLKLLALDAADGQSGIGQDLTGYSFETTVAGLQDGDGGTHITFAKHTANSKTYTRLAEIDGNGNFNAKGQVKENGTRVYSPNNKPTPSSIGAAASSHTHSYNDLTNKPTIPSAYTLPTASTTTKGGIKVGAGLSISSEVLSHNTAAGYKHIPFGGAYGQVLKYSSSGTAIWDYLMDRTSENKSGVSLMMKPGMCINPTGSINISFANLSSSEIANGNTAYIIHHTTHPITVRITLSSIGVILFENHGTMDVPNSNTDFTITETGHIKLTWIAKTTVIIEQYGSSNRSKVLKG